MIEKPMLNMAFVLSVRHAVLMCVTNIFKCAVTSLSADRQACNDVHFPCPSVTGSLWVWTRCDRFI